MKPKWTSAALLAAALVAATGCGEDPPPTPPADAGGGGSGGAGDAGGGDDAGADDAADDTPPEASTEFPAGCDVAPRYLLDDVEQAQAGAAATKAGATLAVVHFTPTEAGKTARLTIKFDNAGGGNFQQLCFGTCSGIINQPAEGNVETALAGKLGTASWDTSVDPPKVTLVFDYSDTDAKFAAFDRLRACGTALPANPP